ncbi:unnamed protein product [Peniophora sp. CBMAI 1063]|nr:unnamed protein product [Peniophora sp. CBMAI 1063]
MGFYDQVVLPGTALLGSLYPSSTVDLGYATYAAANTSLTPGVTSFLGIRYAAPPTGELRFNAPQAPHVVEDVQQSAMPPPCYGGAAFGLATEPTFYNAGGKAANVSTLNPFDIADGSSEDCLFLNIHVPDSLKLEGNTSVPVLVWIHGGGYIGGSHMMYPAENLARNAHGGLVVVSVQYRLGPFGFLAGKDVKEGGALNAGLLDQELALKWVQKHITKFGGDPDRVAIFGNSAGAGSVLQHVVAHAGNTQPPLFRAALVSSTFLPSQYAWNDPVSEALYRTIAKEVGCTGEGVLRCLRAVDPGALTLAGARATYAGFLGTFSFVPVVDGAFIVERPYKTLQRKSVNGEMVFATSTTDEGFIFAPESITTSLGLEEYVKGLFPALQGEDVRRAVELYTGSGADVASAASQIMDEVIFSCPGYTVLDAFAGAGKPAWKGLFDVTPAWHGHDLLYIFEAEIHGITARLIPPSDTELGHAMRAAFIGAATDLDPNSLAATPDWPRYTEDAHVEMLFNRTQDGLQSNMEAFPTNHALLERCAFWQGIADMTAQ